MTDPKVLISVIRKALPAMIAQDILGVQPMTAAAGSIFGMSNAESMNCEQYLQYLSKRYTNWTSLGQTERTGNGIIDATEMMQRRFPGPYKLVEKYDSKRGLFSLALEFESPQEELMWKIKWSS